MISDISWLFFFVGASQFTEIITRGSDFGIIENTLKYGLFFSFTMLFAFFYKLRILSVYKYFMPIFICFNC